MLRGAETAGANMPYAKRDSRGDIVELHGSPTEDAREKLSFDDPDLLNFVSGQGKHRGLTDYLSATDHELARVLEDLVSILIQRGVINFTDFPPEAQRKLIKRREVRNELNSEPDFMVKKSDVL